MCNYTLHWVERSRKEGGGVKSFVYKGHCDAKEQGHGGVMVSVLDFRSEDQWFQSGPVPAIVLFL